MRRLGWSPVFIPASPARRWAHGWKLWASARIFPPACWRRGNSKAEFVLGLGSTLAFRRCDLEDIGGFEALVDYLADDYEIGRRIAERGLRVTLSDVVVEAFLPDYTLRQFVDHQLRWGCTKRDLRHWGYLGLVLTFGFPWALVAVVGTLRCALGVGPARCGPGPASRGGRGRGIVGIRVIGRCCGRCPGFHCGIWSPCWSGWRA